MFWRFLKDPGGATAIEYGLIAGLISLAIIGSVSAFGSSLETLWDENSRRLQESTK